MDRNHLPWLSESSKFRVGFYFKVPYRAGNEQYFYPRRVVKERRSRPGISFSQEKLDNVFECTNETGHVFKLNFSTDKIIEWLNDARVARTYVNGGDYMHVTPCQIWICPVLVYRDEVIDLGVVHQYREDHSLCRNSEEPPKFAKTLVLMERVTYIEEIDFTKSMQLMESLGYEELGRRAVKNHAFD